MGGKSRRNPVTDEQIISAYRDVRSAYKVAAALGIGDTTVHRVLTKHGVPRDGLEVFRRSRGPFKGREANIRQDYEDGMTYKALRAKYGHASVDAIRTAIKRAGGTLRDDPAPRETPQEVDRVREMNALGFGQTRISLELGRSQTFISRLMRRHGIPTKKEAGSSHSNWKGGRYGDSSGYVRIWVADDDMAACMKLNDNTVLEHRYVMAHKLGRPLLRSETVHHINGNKVDNRPENLELRQGRHGKHIAMCCLECGSRNVGPAPLASEVN